MEEEKVVVEEAVEQKPAKKKKGIFAKVVFFIWLAITLFTFLGGLLPTTFFAIVTVYIMGLSVLPILVFLILGIIALVTAKGNKAGKTMGLLVLVLCWLPFALGLAGLYLYKIIGK